MSEYELVHRCAIASNAASSNKARTGELILNVPCGYVKLPAGEVALDPDEQVRATVQLIFDKFDELGSCRRLYRYLLRNGIRLGIRVHRGPRRGELVWRRPTPAHAESDAASSDLRGGLFLRTSSRRSQADGRRAAARSGCGRYRCRSGRCCSGTASRPISRGSVTWPISSGCSRTARGPVLPGCPRRRGPADGPAGLRGLWPAHARRLPQQADSLLSVRTQERTRDRSVADWRPAAIDDLVAAAGPRGLGAGRRGAEPEGDRRRRTENGSGSTATGSSGWSGPPTRPNAPSGSIRRSSPRIAWWPGAWSDAGRRRCGRSSRSDGRI